MENIEVEEQAMLFQSSAREKICESISIESKPFIWHENFHLLFNSEP